jgi:hypothetical protein
VKRLKNCKSRSLDDLRKNFGPRISVHLNCKDQKCDTFPTDVVCLATLSCYSDWGVCKSNFQPAPWFTLSSSTEESAVSYTKLSLCKKRWISANPKCNQRVWLILGLYFLPFLEFSVHYPTAMRCIEDRLRCLPHCCERGQGLLVWSSSIMLWYGLAQGQHSYALVHSDVR